MRKLFLLVSCCCCLTVLFAQQSSVTLKARKEGLLSVLAKIEKQAGVEFSYSSDLVDTRRKVSVDVKNASLEETLKALFADGPVGYTIKGNQVILYKNPHYKVIISGYMREEGSGELLIGATVSTLPRYAGCVTNGYGFYSLTLPADTYALEFSYIGYQTRKVHLLADESKQISIDLTPATTLDEALVSGTTESKELQPNKVDVPIAEIKEIPSVLGERDVVKYIMLSPGVQKGSEGNGYMYVRGGGPDQNLVLIDDAVIYNAYHFLGLSSLFSGNELRKAELYKGGFSSKYGGRLSSVLDMSMKDGNREHYGAEATIGIISSRVMVEGPILKGKSSFLLSARKSYIDEVSKLVTTNGSGALDYGYYDLHAKVSTDIGTHDRLMLSAYWGQDGLSNNTTTVLDPQDDGIFWGNRAVSFRWNHQLSGRWFVNTSLISSYYKNRIAFGEYDNDAVKASSSAVESAINDYTVKTDFDYLRSSRHHFKFGGGYTYHYFTPRTSYFTTQPDSAYEAGQSYGAREWFAYGEWQFQLSNRWHMTTGLRLTHFRNFAAYNRAEPRLNIGYRTNTNWQFNLSYALMNQYLHLISAFNGLGLPSDAWVSSNDNLKPQRSNLVTLGAVKNNLGGYPMSFSAEVYGKHIANAVSLKEGASFYQVLPAKYMMNQVNDWSEIATQGNVLSYGLEMMLRTGWKKINGYISYTLSKTDMTFESLNLGRTFPASFDRRHDIGVYLSYQPGKKVKLTANWVYGTGAAISLPEGEYFPIDPNNQGGSASRYYYSKKNGYRMQSYHRLDIAVQYQHAVGKLATGTFELSIFNVYNRANPFYYTIEAKGDGSGSGTRHLQKVSLFPIMPSLSWGIKF